MTNCSAAARKKQVLGSSRAIQSSSYRQARSWPTRFVHNIKSRRYSINVDIAVRQSYYPLAVPYTDVFSAYSNVVQLPSVPRLGGWGAIEAVSRAREPTEPGGLIEMVETTDSKSNSSCCSICCTVFARVSLGGSGRRRLHLTSALRDIVSRLQVWPATITFPV